MVRKISRYPAGVSWRHVGDGSPERFTTSLRKHDKSKTCLRKRFASKQVLCYRDPTLKRMRGVSEGEICNVYVATFFEHYKWCIEQGYDNETAVRLIEQIHVNLWKARTKIKTADLIYPLATLALVLHRERMASR